MQSEMFNVLKYQVETMDFNLTEMKKKISNAYAWDEVTEDEYNELMQLANQNAKPDGMTADLQSQINALAERVKALEEGKSDDGKDEGGDDDGGEDDNIKAWEPWDGITRPLPYQKGSKVTHKGKTWISGVDNNIWEPGGIGVLFNIWAEVKE